MIVQFRRVMVDVETRRRLRKAAEQKAIARRARSNEDQRLATMRAKGWDV